MKQIKKLYYDRSSGNYYEVIPYGQKAQVSETTAPNPQNTVSVHYQQPTVNLPFYPVNAFNQSMGGMSVSPQEFGHMLNVDPMKMHINAITEQFRAQLENAYRQSMTNTQQTAQQDVQIPLDQQLLEYYKGNIQNNTQPQTQTPEEILGEIVAPPFEEGE